MTGRVEGLRELEDDLEHAGERFREGAKKILSKTGLEIKREAKVNYYRGVRHRGGGHIPHLPGTITYDVTVRKYDMDVEVGPDITKIVPGKGGEPSRPGPLGGFPEEGLETGNLSQAPRPYLRPAYEHQYPIAARHLEDLAEEILDGRAH